MTWVRDQYQLVARDEFRFEIVIFWLEREQGDVQFSISKVRHQALGTVAKDLRANPRITLQKCFQDPRKQMQAYTFIRADAQPSGAQVANILESGRCFVT